jgi:transposase InsO family protein
VAWIGIGQSKYFDWKQRYGKVNEHNAKVPRDHWLEDDERQSILDYQQKKPLEGYRRLTYMMMDADVVAASPATVYRVLKSAGLMSRWNQKPTAKGTGFVQPLQPHEHWHVDLAYVNICSTFYYLCSVLDGCSRFIVHSEVRESMKESDVEIVLQKAREKFPNAKPRIITDNGSQFIAKDFKEFIRLSGMSHVRTSPYYPQSNGKIERWHKTIKQDCIRPAILLSKDDANRTIKKFIEHYNNQRLHSSIGYVTPADRIKGNHTTIYAQRDAKLKEARQRRAANRKRQRENSEQVQVENQNQLQLQMD